MRPLRRRKAGGPSLAAFVYRFDETAGLDWKRFIGGDTLRLLPLDSSAQRGAKEHLMREHLTAILEEGVVYSLPGIAVGGVRCSRGWGASDLLSGGACWRRAAEDGWWVGLQVVGQGERVVSAGVAEGGRRGGGRRRASVVL